MGKGSREVQQTTTMATQMMLMGKGGSRCPPLRDQMGLLAWERASGIQMWVQLHVSAQIMRNSGHPRDRSCWKRHLVSLPGNKLREERIREAYRAEAVAAIAQACAKCRHCGRADRLLARDRDAHVLWVGSSYTFELPVPICFCQHCNKETAALPLEAECFPSTPSHAWDLCSVPCTARPLWFDLAMLEVRAHCLCRHASNTLHACRPAALEPLQPCSCISACMQAPGSHTCCCIQALDSMVCVVKRLSMDRISETILKAHERTGCSEHISWDVFRKRLQGALLELGYIKAKLADWRLLGAGSYPVGLFSSCRGLLVCWQTWSGEAVE